MSFFGLLGVFSIRVNDPQWLNFNTSDVFALQLLLNATDNLNEPRTEKGIYKWFSVIKGCCDSALHKPLVI